jgi:heparin/heparan-sulfate lyase
MKIGTVNTANHDHQDAGTFQIHYKGLTTGASGGYGSYGTDHWLYYHQATVSKNGILIFDPSKTGDYEGYYSGSQLMFNDSAPSKLSDLTSGSGSYYELFGYIVNTKYRRATLLGHSSAYKADGVTPEYAYIAGNISNAYDSSKQASYVARSMLTAYTEDKTVPMIFFVFDRIDATKDSLIKKFLLQVNGQNAPTVDATNKRVTLKESNGRLVLQNVIGCDSIESIGGGKGYNYMVNGKQIADSSFSETKSWDRVELHNKSGKSSNMMLNVIYVTDSGSTKILNVKNVVGYDASGSTKLFEGASAYGITALFATDKSAVTKTFKFTTEGSGNMTYYIGGVGAGNWNIFVGGQLLTTKSVTSEESFLTFKATAGAEITVEKA